MEDQRNNNPTEDEIEIETTNDGEGFDVITLESEDGPADYLYLDLITMRCFCPWRGKTPRKRAC